MRINSLKDALAYFPDFDGFWKSDNLMQTENEIIGRLSPKWATEWSSSSIELLTQLARVQALQGRFSDARVTLEQAQQMISESTQTIDPRARIRWLLEHGRLLGLSMSINKAHDQFVLAWNLANETGNIYFAVDAALMLSTLRPPRFQNDWLKKALELAEGAQDEKVRGWLPHLLLLNGWYAYDNHQYQNALEIFETALAQPVVKNDEAKARPLQWSRACCLRALARTEEALEIQEALLNRMRLVGKVNGYVYLEIAECKQLLKAKEEAKSFFELAHTELSNDPWYVDNKKDDLDRMKYLFKKR